MRRRILKSDFDIEADASELLEETPGEELGDDEIKPDE
jgi:hypothetical protein